jgi:hypothetical protein
LFRALGQHFQPIGLHLQRVRNCLRQRFRKPRIIHVKRLPAGPTAVGVCETVVPPQLPGTEEMPGSLEKCGSGS